MRWLMFSYVGWELSTLIFCYVLWIWIFDGSGIFLLFFFQLVFSNRCFAELVPSSCFMTMKRGHDLIHNVKISTFRLPWKQHKKHKVQKLIINLTWVTECGSCFCVRSFHLFKIANVAVLHYSLVCYGMNYEVAAYSYMSLGWVQ